MFDNEQKAIEAKIKEYCEQSDIPLAELKWQPIPFNGEWGISTSFFQTAANEARSGNGTGKPVPQRAQEIAEQVKSHIGRIKGISRVEAVKGYLNLYFSTEEYASRVVNTILKQGINFGRGEKKSERVWLNLHNLTRTILSILGIRAILSLVNHWHGLLNLLDSKPSGQHILATLDWA